MMTARAEMAACAGGENERVAGRASIARRANSTRGARMARHLLRTLVVCSAVLGRLSVEVSGLCGAAGRNVALALVGVI